LSEFVGFNSEFFEILKHFRSTEVLESLGIV
jgi:hypothetical protein